MVNLGGGIKNVITCCRSLGGSVFHYGVAAEAGYCEPVQPFP